MRDERPLAAARPRSRVDNDPLRRCAAALARL
jgi:hypothetical protein